MNRPEPISPERFGYFFENPEAGMETSCVKKQTVEDIEVLASLSGDDNSIQLDDDFASRTLCKSHIAHGILMAGVIPTVLGAKCAGPDCIYIS